MSNKPYIKFFLLLICVQFCTSCNFVDIPEEKEVNFKPISFSQIQHWRQDKHADALKSFAHSCKRIVARKPISQISYLTYLGNVSSHWQRPCMALKKMKNYNHEDARRFFEHWFTPYKIINNKQSIKALFTAYYEIELRASQKKTQRYSIPIYKRPKNLKKIKGKHDRYAINSGVFSGKGLEILWTDNEPRLYFMQMQGSGVAVLPNGKEIGLGFDGGNGFDFIPIHKEFQKYRRARPSQSTESMLSWLESNPRLATRIIEHNPSYTFFKKKKSKNLVGAQGAPLTSGRSIAIDSSIYPYGAPIWIETRTPKVNKDYRGRRYARLMIAQDTGGLIKGSLRGDLFLGRGALIEKVSHKMHNSGKMYILMPKSVPMPEQYTSFKKKL